MPSYLGRQRGCLDFLSSYLDILCGLLKLSYLVVHTVNLTVCKLSNVLEEFALKPRRIKLKIKIIFFVRSSEVRFCFKYAIS